MKRRRFLPLVLICTAFAADAAMVTTSLFSFDVPDQWNVEDNKTNIVLAFGSKVVAGMPSPYLSVQYCANGNSSKDLGQLRCRLPCNDEAANLVSSSPLKAAQFSPVAKIEKGSGVTEFSSESISSAPVSALVVLSCNSQGQVHFGLVSDLPREIAKQQLADILKSLQWK